MACKGGCVRYKAAPGGGGYTLRYAGGQKRYQICQIYLDWPTNNYCPCCGNKLRIKPREGELKRRCDDIIRQRQERSHMQ
ncbi:hypothetical protein BH23THE1_BH23THE1_09950 [soil metagenome]